MVNASLNWASIVGIVLAVGGAMLYFMRSFKPALARDYDVFFAAVGLLCGGILFFQGWRLDPILQFGQFLLAGTTVFFAYESVRLRGVTTEQARRSSYFDDEEPAPRPRMGGGREWGEGVDRFDEPQPLRRRIRSRDGEGYGEREEEEDFYRPRRNPRAAIPERAASRGSRSESNDWGGRSPATPERSSPGAPPADDSWGRRPGRYSAGGATATGGPIDFGARRQNRDDLRRGSRPSAAADSMPRSSRRPGPADSEPSGIPSRGVATPGIPQGAPYQQGRPPAGGGPSTPGVSDADFRPVRPSGGQGGGPGTSPMGGPPSGGSTGRSDGPPSRDNSSRFDD